LSNSKKSIGNEKDYEKTKIDIGDNIINIKISIKLEDIVEGDAQEESK